MLSSLRVGINGTAMLGRNAGRHACAAFKGWSTETPSYVSRQRRGYVHFEKTAPDDFELPMDTMPKDMDAVLKKDPKSLDFFENYWYWRIRAESTILDAENLPKKSYKQLARDMGLQLVTKQNEHMCAVIELYEYLRSATFVGPFGTVKNPVLVPSVTDKRMVGCMGGPGDEEHHALYFWCREGFMYRCGECDQIFMHVRVNYSLPDGQDPFPIDPEVTDVFDVDLIEKNQMMFNSGDFVLWPEGNTVYTQKFLKGDYGAIPDSGKRLIEVEKIKSQPQLE